MKILKLLSILVLIITLCNCKSEKKENTNDEPIMEIEEQTTEVMEEEPMAKTIEISLEPKSGSKVSGTVNFTEESGMVTMVADLTGLSKGTHAIHLHDKADCSSDDGKSTGGHWNPTMQPHGKWGATEGYHKGDIGNFSADDTGNGSITFATNEWCIGCGDDKKDIMSKAVIVHEGTDDFTSQPSGDAGTRISCGGIIEL